MNNATPQSERLGRWSQDPSRDDCDDVRTDCTSRGARASSLVTVVGLRELTESLDSADVLRIFTVDLLSVDEKPLVAHLVPRDQYERWWRTVGPHERHLVQNMLEMKDQDHDNTES